MSLDDIRKRVAEVQARITAIRDRPPNDPERLELIREYAQLRKEEQEAACGGGPDAKHDKHQTQTISVDDFYAYMPTHSYIFVPCARFGPPAVLMPASRFLKIRLVGGSIGTGQLSR